MGASSFPNVFRFIYSDNGLRPAAETLLSKNLGESFGQLPNSSKLIWSPTFAVLIIRSQDLWTKLLKSFLFLPSDNFSR